MRSQSRPLFLVLLGFYVMATPVGAGQRPGSTDLARDIRHTIAARKLLSEDTELAAWNIGVTVTNRVGVLFGPVPTADLAYRAEMRLRILVELIEVRNELFVSPLVEPMRIPLKIDNPPSGFRLQEWNLPPNSGLNPGAPATLTGQHKKKSAGATPASKEKASPLPIQVLPPEKLDPRPSQPRRLPMGETNAGPEGSNLDGEIRRFLQSKDTFRSVEFAIKGGRVYLRSVNAEILPEAARGIARLAGVESVILVDQPRQP